MKKITPFLWFDKNLKEIKDYYLSIFPDAEFESNGTLSDTPSGKVETGTLKLLGQEFSVMTAGPLFTFNEAVSFVINCEDQNEVDYYWEKLTTNGGEESQCGWCKDAYGLSWQIVPKALGELMSKGTDKQKSQVVQAFIKMKKFDIAALEEAFNA